jgi:asparagine synthase (glutamine-hydrolysing)
MCGIFGHIGHISKQQAIACTDALAHRGPDGSGLWHRDDAALGHRRLAILDLSEQGAQPMSYAKGRYWITYNGEIYNFLEIRKELEAKGYQFKSESDTEVILASFTEWREDCLQKFNGMWAFAIWDDREKMLFLSRDRFGKKPLFYAPVPSGFAFASEMKALFPLMPQLKPNVRLVQDRNRIFQYEHTEETLIEGIKRFPAGHYGWWKGGRLTTHRWWCTLDHLVPVPERYEEQVDQCRALFLDACRLRMRSDVPIGTALSGGLDSSSTISAMAHIGLTSTENRVSKDWQHAFVACFPGTPLDEQRYAKMVTDNLGIEASFLDIDPLKVIDKIDRYHYLFEELYITSPIPFMMTYGEMRRKGVKVTVDGHGADELFAGYFFDYVHALNDSLFNVRASKMILDTYYDSYPKSSLQFSLPPKWRYFLRWHSVRFAKKLLGRRPAQGEDSSHPEWSRLDSLAKRLYESTHTSILPTLLRNYDRYSMANGVEIRMPFMDHRIVSFAFSIPWTSKLRNTFSKAIIRDAMAPFMPHDIAYRKGKIGFNSPIIDWMQGPLKPFFLDVINTESFKKCALIDPLAVSRQITDVIENAGATFSMGEQAWTNLMPYLWERALLKGSYVSQTV